MASYLEPDLSSDEEAEQPRVRTHIVVDGDSLPRLAQRYLGDPGRCWEIFATNRDVLSDPHLLPIGVELKLPPKAGGPSNIQAHFRAPGSSSPTIADRGLVPLRPVIFNNGPPEARLLRPQAVRRVYED